MMRRVLAAIACAVLFAGCSSGGDGQLGKLASTEAIIAAQIITAGAHFSSDVTDYDAIEIGVVEVLDPVDAGREPLPVAGTRMVVRSFDAESFTPGVRLVLFLAHDGRFGDHAWSVEFALDAGSGTPAAQSDDRETRDAIGGVLLEGEDRSDLLDALVDLVDEYRRRQGDNTPRRDALYPP